ncbi:DUF2797 domain-containing protein [Dasania sp. GY-MA-18]|uniref:DUF2797 domain-containing protein n=1 Tax=Dasania phycosphaerae TaxID=2950436 RepID=A0A9J6RS50_9GAMM|nr:MULTISPECIES: DUF2797 domain-containing protein [Dasania]MCR8924248.1 DUF2797 domain-containing protein [Dasania sp. GY-MA-18]MCZ0866901.1 DUF2797 domain-containing protein [Dasania phycosphaerae]MCZ0870405.1 DUF2797 domain-containing protein [Dasania phycosphaerae]
MPALIAEGALRKMQTSLQQHNGQPMVSYNLPVGEQTVAMNALLGQPIAIHYQGSIFCQHCGRKSNKSFSQGFCYPCFKKLAQCDSCIMSPEKCHYFEGTCREPEWADLHCMQDHYVYLANSTGVKVGITRGNQIPTRWMDQGAIQALPIFRVSNRLQSGLVEVMFKDHVADKTNWRKMLKGEVEAIDLIAQREQLFAQCQAQINELQQQHGVQAIQQLSDAELVDIDYPVQEYPTKISSFNLDKTPVVEGVLKGIKGQYLILDTGVINIRKYSAYQIQFFA